MGDVVELALLTMVFIALAAGGFLLAMKVRIRGCRSQPRFAPYRPVGRAARWQHTRDDPDDTVELSDFPGHARATRLVTERTAQ